VRDLVTGGILDAAAGVLAARGEAASMAEIAEAAGVGRATLYRYFPNRDALLTSLFDQAVDELGRRIVDAQLDTVPVAEGIARLNRLFLAAGVRYAALARLDKKKAPMLELERPVRALLARGVRDGTLRADLPADLLFDTFTGLLERALRLVIEKRMGVEQAGAAIGTLFLNGAQA
jgi:TetR/AcrR family transcriptional repressor of mexCD-oprJ operon